VLQEIRYLFLLTNSFYRYLLDICTRHSVKHSGRQTRIRNGTCPQGGYTLPLDLAGHGQLQYDAFYTPHAGKLVDVFYMEEKIKVLQNK